MGSRSWSAPALLTAFMRSSVASGGFPTGCVVRGRTWHSPTRPLSVNASDALDCQAACEGRDSCTNFSWWPLRGDCQLVDSTALELRSPQESEDEVIVGPDFCGSAVACSAVAASSFPGASEAADWPDLGYQPQTLQCWPGFCDRVQLAKDVPASVSWTRTCETWGLAVLDPGESCQDRCFAEAGCSSFAKTADGECWVSAGFDCDAAHDARALNQEPESPQRLLRGDVRVLKELIALRVPGLVLAFRVSDFTWKTIDKDVADACAQICYSLLACQYWQYNSDPSTGGCYIQASENSVPYPLHETDLLLANPDWMMGEFIQHTCPPITIFGIEVPAWATNFWIQVSAGALLLMCILGCASRILLAWRRSKKKNRSRGLTAEAGSEVDQVGAVRRLLEAERKAELNASQPPEPEARTVSPSPSFASYPSIPSFASGTPLLTPMPHIGTPHLPAQPHVLAQRTKSYAYIMVPQVVSVGAAVSSTAKLSVASSSAGVLSAPPSPAFTAPHRQTTISSPAPALREPARSSSHAPQPAQEPEQWGTALTVQPSGM